MHLRRQHPSIHPFPARYHNQYTPNDQCAKAISSHRFEACAHQIFKTNVQFSQPTWVPHGVQCVVYGPVNICSIVLMDGRQIIPHALIVCVRVSMHAPVSTWYCVKGTCGQCQQAAGIASNRWLHLGAFSRSGCDSQTHMLAVAVAYNADRAEQYLSRWVGVGVGVWDASAQTLDGLWLVNMHEHDDYYGWEDMHITKDICVLIDIL